MSDVGTLVPAGYHVDTPGGVPHAAHGTPEILPPGYHVDSPGGTPHAAHGPAAATPHEAHGPVQAYDAVIDRIFETRKGIKSAKSDAELLEVHHPVSQIHKDLVTLRGMVAEFKVDHALFDAWLKDATEAAKLIEQEAHEGNAAKTRELIARFDKGILAIEDLIHHPAAPSTSSDLPVGFHVDAPGGVPHQDHGDEHGAGQAYSAVIDRIFETRKSIKSAKSDEEVLDVHHAVSEIHNDLALLRELVKGFSNLDFAQFDESLKDAKLTTKIIEEQAHEGNAEETRKLIARFDKSVLAIEELVNHPTNLGNEGITEGFHVDKPGGRPHKDHDH